jgi:hypothetical protein
LSRAGTPAPPSEPPSAENNAADDEVLRQLAAVILDLKQLQTHTLAIWHEEISMMLPDMSDFRDEDKLKAEGIVL